MLRSLGTFFLYRWAVWGKGGCHLHGEAGPRWRVLPPRGGAVRGGAVHRLVQVDYAASIRGSSWTNSVIDRVSERECWRRSVSGGRLLASPGSSWSSWQSDIAGSLMVRGLYRDIATRVVTRHRAGVVVVRQCARREIMRQSSGSLKW